MRPSRIHVVTYNIHKGLSRFNRRVMLHELRDQLRRMGPDIIFLQEVQGMHEKHARKFSDWPEKPQQDFLAEDFWQSAAYGRNVVYGHGHHGNAILARFPISHSHNQEVTQVRFERRGLLHCVMDIPGLARTVHCVCVHLSLFARSRRRQMDALAGYLEEAAGQEEPLIIAGDFNDWRNEAEDLMATRLGLTEAFRAASGGFRSPGRSYPAEAPVLRLDRIYVRGFSVIHAEIHTGSPWSRISDHAPLSADLVSD